MKILITGNSMSYMSGQPLYCYELAMELKRQGHQIEVRSAWRQYGGSDGHKLFENLCKAGIRCTGWDSTWLTKDFDLWLASEPISMRVNEHIPDVPMINIIHSEYDVESPIMKRPFAYVCIRPSIVEHIVKEHGVTKELCHVVYNGVDRERFKKIEKPKRDYRVIVAPCTFDPLRRKFIEHLVDIANEKRHVHFYGNPHGVKIQETEFVKVFPDTFNIEQPIAEADEVAGILLGRVNLEANSCGVPSRIYDPVTLENSPFLLPEKEFDNKHNIKNVAKQIIKIAGNYSLDDLTIVIPHHDQHKRLADILGDLEDVKNIVIKRGGTFAQNCNEGFKLCKTKYVCFLNDDTRIKEVRALFFDMMRLLEDFQIVGCRVEGDGKVNGFRIEKNKMIPVLNSEDPIDTPSGHCLMMKANTFKTLNGYSEEFRNGCEDGDLYMRAMEMGMKITASKITMQHLQCQSSGRFDYIDENVILYNKKWGKITKDMHMERAGATGPLKQDNWKKV